MWRAPFACVVCVIAGVVAPATWAAGVQETEQPAPLSWTQLVIAGSPDEAAQLQAARKAFLVSPEAERARVQSQTSYHNLSDSGARSLANNLFKNLIVDPAGGPPQLPSGAHITGYPSDFSASIKLPHARSAVLESSVPIAVGSANHRTPLDLKLRRTANGDFKPTSSVTEMQIPARLSKGALLQKIGVSLTPVGDNGVPLGSVPGAIDGTTVFYGKSENHQAGVVDVDTVLKPNTTGFSEETLLRSQLSPQQLYFKIGVPHGAKLQRGSNGAIQVVKGRIIIASIPNPAASDAQNTPVPVSTRLVGDLLVMTVSHRNHNYDMPIDVDPSVRDEGLTTSGVNATDWHYVPSEGAKEFSGSEHAGESKWTIHIGGNHTATESGALVYTTQGASSIASFSIEGTWETANSHIENLLQIITPAKVVENTNFLPASSTVTGNWSVCGKCFEEPYKLGAGNNTALFDQQSTAAGSGVGGEATLTHASVLIEQEKGAEVSFDKTSPTVDGGRLNVLYGTGAWLGPNSGAFELHAKDSGIGVSFLGVSGGAWAETFPIYENGECTGGVQCPPLLIVGSPTQVNWRTGKTRFLPPRVTQQSRQAHVHYRIPKDSY